MTDAIKLKVLSQFPARLIGRAGIDVTKTTGDYYLDLDFTDFPVIGVVPAGTAYALIFDPATGLYSQLPISLLGGGGGGAAPATAIPLVENGPGAIGISLKYAREDHIHPAFGGGGITDGPSDGTLYGRKNAAWSAALETIRGYLAGLTLSTAGASASFGIAAGVAADNGNAAMMTLAAAITKTTAAWAVGSGAGSFDGTGAAPSATAGWYHAYLIRRPDTGVVDVLTSNSATAPTLPANYTQFRRIGSMKTNGSFQWVAFVQEGDEFLFATQVLDASPTTQSTTAVLYALTVPTGVKVTALCSLSIDNTTNGGNVNVYVSSPDQSDEPVSIPGVAAFATLGMYNAGVGEGVFTTEMRKRTNTSAQVRMRASALCGKIWIYTHGWIDTRGRFA